jgi:tetratricopeptide (TPR) repeat protein
MTIETELQQAISHHQANRLDIAEQLYRSILMAEPEHPDANHNFGVLTLQRGDLAEGIAYLRTALSAAPQRRNFWASYVNVLAQSGNHDEAQRASEMARQYGFVVRASGADRASVLPSGTALDEANVAETVASIEALTARGEHEEAETLALQLVMTYPDHGSGWKALAYAQLRRGELGKALAPLEQATALLPDDPELDRHLHAARAMHEGLQLEASGELAEAGQRFQEVLETYPDYPQANHRLGVVAIRLHRPVDAIPLIGKAIGADPDNLQYWAHYIDALLQSDRPGTRSTRRRNEALPARRSTS